MSHTERHPYFNPYAQTPYLSYDLDVTINEQTGEGPNLL